MKHKELLKIQRYYRVRDAMGWVALLTATALMVLAACSI